MSGSSNFNVKKLGAVSAVLAIILMSCGGSTTSSNAGRAKNTKLADGTICYTPDERSGLIAAAVAVEYQAAVAFQPAIKYQQAVSAQAAVEAQAAIAEEIATQDYEAVAPQPEVAYRAGVPAQPAVPGGSEMVLSVNEGWYMPYDWGTYIWANTDGGRDVKAVGWVISSTEIMHNGFQLLRRIPGSAGQPEVAAIAEVKYQAAVPGRPAIRKGDVLTEAIAGREAQAAVEAREEVLAQPAVMARDEVQAKTKDEVIAAINDIKDCPDDSAAIVIANQVETAHLSDIEYGAGSITVSILNATDEQISLGLSVWMYGGLCGQMGCLHGGITFDNLTQVFQVSECAVGSIVLIDFQGRAIDSKPFEATGAACNVVSQGGTTAHLSEVSYGNGTVVISVLDATGDELSSGMQLILNQSANGESCAGASCIFGAPRNGEFVFKVSECTTGTFVLKSDSGDFIDTKSFEMPGSACAVDTPEGATAHLSDVSYGDGTVVISVLDATGDELSSGMQLILNQSANGESCAGASCIFGAPRNGEFVFKVSECTTGTIDLKSSSGEFIDSSYFEMPGAECNTSNQNSYFSNLSYSEDMKTAYINVINPPSTTWGVGHGLCEDGVLTQFNSISTSYAISGIENCPEGYFVLFSGDQAIDKAVFGIVPLTPQIDHEYSIDVVTSEDSVIGTLLVDGEPCPKEPVAGNPCEDIAISYSVDYEYWEFDGKDSCEFVVHCVQQSISNLRAGTKGYFVAVYAAVPECPCAQVSELVTFEIKGKSDVTVTTVVNPVAPIVSLTDLLLVKDVVMSQVVPVDLSEAICSAECVTDLQTSAGISGDVFVQVDNGDFVEVRAGSRIALGDSSSAVKIQVRPRDGSTPVDMVVNLNRSTNGLDASEGSSSNIPLIPLGLLAIVLIALYVVKTYVLDNRKVNS